MSFTTVIVTGTLENSAGQPVTDATVQFSLSTGLISTNNGTMVSPTPVRTSTDSNGNFSVALTATDDPTTTPKGQIYRCDIHSPSFASVYSINPFPPFFFPLPRASAPTVSLTSLITPPYA
jgi:hypothetical protein